MARAGDGAKRSDQRRAEARLTKRLTLSALADFEARARAAGFASGHAYLSAFILGHVDLDVRRDRIRTLGHLGKVGSNLNQIAKRLNSGEAIALSEHDVEVIEHVLAAVEAVGTELRAALS